MTPNISLKWLLAILIPGLVLVIVTGYSIISAEFFIRGMDSIVFGNMGRAAKTYLRTIPAEERQSLNEFSGYFMAPSWEKLPKDVTQVFGCSPEKSDTLYKHDPSGFFEKPDKITFVIRYDIEKDHAVEPVYVASVFTREKASPIVGQRISQSMTQLVLFSILVTLSLFLLAWLVYRFVSRPIDKLYEWTRNLDAKTVKQDRPNFSFPEVNSLADTIKSNFIRLQDSLEREQRFLRHASHELRTPISVVRSNIELAQKLIEKNGDKTESQSLSRPIIDRIDRASLTMKHLTETLLWLNREKENEVLPQVTLQLDNVLTQTIEDNAYLIRDKSLKLSIDTEAYQVTVEEQPTRIVIGNLIRNAFQHSWSGDIVIEQKGAQILIQNPIAKEEETRDKKIDLGFGLGLKLIEQLSEKLGWHYEKEKTKDTYTVRVRIGRPGAGHYT